MRAVEVLPFSSELVTLCSQTQERLTLDERCLDTLLCRSRRSLFGHYVSRMDRSMDLDNLETPAVSKNLTTQKGNWRSNLCQLH